MTVCSKIPTESTQKTADQLHEVVSYLAGAHMLLRRIEAARKWGRSNEATHSEGLLNRVATDVLLTIHVVEGMARTSTALELRVPAKDIFPAEVAVQ
jgi:hypothetical protein